ncbi:MAG: lytic murein transglycosylase [Desulfotignum sp.]|nr:lytic murein transglycosylase [Desulfotignum sp.]
MKKCVLTIVGILFLVLPGAAWGGDFRQWLEDFYPQVANEGISRATWETAFDGIEQPDVRVLAKARFQSEFTVEIWEYLDSRVTPLSVERGLQMERYYARTFAAVESRFGVEAKVLLAIWSMESDYGAVFDKPERLHYVPQALATLAYAVDMDGNGRRDIWNSVPDALAPAAGKLERGGKVPPSGAAQEKRILFRRN